jgi:hypothetical protein
LEEKWAIMLSDGYVIFRKFTTGCRLPEGRSL